MLYTATAHGKAQESAPQVAKELGLQIGKSDAPQLAIEKAGAGKGKGGKGKKGPKDATPTAPQPQQPQHDPIKVLYMHRPCAQGT